MRILITGALGQVGRCLTTRLSKLENATVLSLDKEALDITNQVAVEELVQEFKPTIIINAAAYTAVDKAENDVDLSYAINRDGPKFLSKAAQKIDAAILHISTDYVFEGDKSGEYSEVDQTNPQGIYGASKLAGEIEVARSCEKHIILRTAWVFSEYGNNFVKTMLRLGCSRGSLSIVGDQFGGPTYAGDIADTLIRISKEINEGNVVEYGVYHFSGLPHVSWFEFSDMIFQQAVKQGVIDKKPMLTKISSEQYPTPAKRPSNSRMSNKKIKSSFNIEASDWKLALNNIKEFVS